MAASAYYFTSKNEENRIFRHTWARPRTWKTRKSQKTRKFFSENFKSEFSILALCKIENLEIRKLGIISPRFPRFSRFPSFDLPVLHFSKNVFFFNILQQAISYFLSMLCFALFSKPFKVFFPSPKIYFQNITLS